MCRRSYSSGRPGFKRAGGTGLISGRKAFQRPFKEGVELHVLGLSIGVPGAVEGFTGETTATSLVIGPPTATG